LGALVVALVGGGLGGYAFHLMAMPLAWMLGAMAVVTGGALCGMKPRIPQLLRLGMLGVLGVMLGASFGPGLASSVLGWWPSLIGLLILTVVTPFAASRFFVAQGHNPVTSYFAAAPGGINEMVGIGSSLGGDDRTIALVHALRILFVVFSVPVWFRLSGASYPATQGGNVVSWGDAVGAPWQALILLACGVLGMPLGRLMRLPAPQLTGPMALSAAVHLMGVSSLRPPSDLVAIAQVVVGSALGARFVGIDPRALLKTALAAIGSSLVMILMAMAAAAAVGVVTGLPFVLLLLSFVPGGVAEMSLVSMALGMDIAFVATHHMVRITLVIALAPLVFRWWWRRRPLIESKEEA
jgi:membrane AbrB-like protein